MISLVALGAIFVLSEYEKKLPQEFIILSPKAGDVWEQDKTYRIEWNGGGEIISTYLINRSLESVGASVSISDRIQNIRNEGSYEYTVPRGLRGEHKIAIHSDGKSVESGYFDIKESIVYENKNYGFSLRLPDEWRGYSAVLSSWRADKGITEGPIKTGPQILVRHPEWTSLNIRQDIPIMVFTLNEWAEVQNGNLIVSAAPIDPSEIGRNSKYVFAIPPRYNYAFPPGWEEVDEIIRDKSRWKFF